MRIEVYCYDCGDELHITASEYDAGVDTLFVEARSCGQCLQKNSDGMYERGRKDEREEDNG